jgi:hypothetical protein
VAQPGPGAIGQLAIGVGGIGTTVLPFAGVTAGRICLNALKRIGVLGVGMSARAEDITDVFFELNSMLAQWNRKRWLVWHLVDATAVSTGAESYSIGVGGDFAYPRADRIEGAFARLLNTTTQPVDYPLGLIQSREDYNQIRLKALNTFPSAVFYDPAWPLGNLFFWPIPAAQTWELHVTLKEQMQQFTQLNDTYNMPPEYLAAINWNLAGWIRPLYGLPPDQTTVALANSTLATIRAENTAVPTLRMPQGLAGPMGQQGFGPVGSAMPGYDPNSSGGGTWGP